MSSTHLTPNLSRPVRVWADTITATQTRCRNRKCRRWIWFAQTVGRGRLLPFEGARVALRDEHEPDTGRRILVFPESQLHFRQCAGQPARPASTSAAPREWQERYDR